MSYESVPSAAKLRTCAAMAAIPGNREREAERGAAECEVKPRSGIEAARIGSEGIFEEV